MYDSNLMIAPDVGGMIQQGIQQGQQSRQQNMAKAAMAALVKDPNNDKALEALASVDPQSAMQFKQQRLEQAKAQLGAHYDSVLKGAQLIRQTRPTDDPSWQQTLILARRAGIDTSQVPAHFDQQYVNSIVQLADAFKPQTETQDPGIIREFQIATERKLIPPGTSYSQYVAMRNPGAQTPVILPHNIQQVGGGQAAPATATDAAGNKVQFNPQSGQWEPIGGQTATPSATFP